MRGVDACPTCGTPVEVVSSDEGTSFYRATASEPEWWGYTVQSPIRGSTPWMRVLDSREAAEAGRESDRKHFPKDKLGPVVALYSKPVGGAPESEREPDAMCHATHWKRHLHEWSGELTLHPYDPEKVASNPDGPPWPVWIGVARRASEPTAEAVERIAFLEARLTAVTKWLEANKPEVFREGIWDAVHASTHAGEEQ